MISETKCYSIVIGSDHAGFELKNQLVDYIKKNIHFDKLEDIGCYNSDPCDYPDFAHLLCKSISESPSIGVLICGTGEGMAMTANKYRFIRAGIAWNTSVAKAIREHNDANVLCLPARHLTLSQATDILHTFLNTARSDEQRHSRRISKISCSNF